MAPPQFRGYGLTGSVKQCQMMAFVADDLGFLGPGIPDLMTELCPPRDAHMSRNMDILGPRKKSATFRSITLRCLNLETPCCKNHAFNREWNFQSRPYRHIRNYCLSNSKTFQDGNGNGNFWKISSNDFQDGSRESMEMKG